MWNTGIHQIMYASHYVLKVGISFQAVHKISKHIMTQYILLLYKEANSPFNFIHEQLILTASEYPYHTLDESSTLYTC